MKIFLGTIISLIIVSCYNKEEHLSAQTISLPANNILSVITNENLADFKWINEPKSFTLENNTLKVIAQKETDFFNNPGDKTITSTAPLLYKQIEGDFVAEALVQPDFSSQWNAVSVMVHIDSTNWIKFAFENSDATGPSIVTVVTKEVSDDANGVVLEDQEKVWLKVVRKGNIYSLLWSLDRKEYKMARLTTLPPIDEVKIGIEAQCPVGKSANHEILYFGIEKKTVNDLRKGE